MSQKVVCVRLMVGAARTSGGIGLAKRRKQGFQKSISHEGRQT
jgi:hypothetical protein